MGLSSSAAAVALSVSTCQCYIFVCNSSLPLRNVAATDSLKGDVKKLSGLFLQCYIFPCAIPADKYTVCEAHGTWHMTKLFYKKM